MEDPGAGWERFRSDIRGAKDIVNINAQKPVLQFYIPIRRRLAKYRPGSGPPPPRIDLRPVHDSDAFIVDKVVLPRGHFQPHDTSRQRRCYYIIGWPDLPAARPVVEASKILDYVSPRTLEDWEYQDALRREEEREQEREKEREAQERAVAKGKAVATPVDGALLPGARRRPGRPPRATMAAETPPEPELNSEQEEMIHKRMRGPSLSTPQKSRLAQLVAEEEMLEELEAVDENAESAIHRELEALGEDVVDSDMNVGMMEDLDLLRLSSAVPGRSSGESSRASSARPALANSPSSAARSAAGVAAPALTRRAKSRRSSASPSRSSQAATRPQISTTPIPLPSYYSQAMKQRIPKPHETSGIASTEPRVQRGSVLTQSDQVHSRRSSSANSPQSHTNGFTPIGGTFPRPPKRPAEDSPLSIHAPAKSKLKKSRKKQAESTPVNVEIPAEAAGSPNLALDLIQGEQDYVVKRLEADTILDGVHWFQVRWEGDWPEGDNPTWEPRENISGKLVKHYLKRKAKREADRLARTASKNKSKTKQPNLLADWAKSCTSVADAFDGQAEMSTGSGTALDQDTACDGDADANDTDGPDELLVTDEENEAAATERRKATEAQILAQFTSMARAVPQRF